MKYADRHLVLFSVSLYGDGPAQPVELSDPIVLPNGLGYAIDLRCFGIEGIAYISLFDEPTKGEINE